MEVSKPVSVMKLHRQIVVAVYNSKEISQRAQLGLKIKGFRMYRKLSLKNVELKTGLPKRSLYLIESGKRAVEVFELQRIAEVLGVNINDLLQDEICQNQKS